MRNASGHNYWNSSFIMDVAMGQIPRFTERISSFTYFEFTVQVSLYHSVPQCFAVWLPVVIISLDYNCALLCTGESCILFYSTYEVVVKKVHVRYLIS